jgi:uncharacterized protein (DUF58 family)
MTPTPRTLALVGTAVAAFAAGGLLPGLFWTGIAVDVLLVSLLVGDAFLLPPPSRFEAERETPRKLSIGEKNPVTLEITYSGAREVRVEAVDEPPREFEMRDLALDLRLLPRRRASVTYFVQPFARGHYEFGDLHLYVRTALGLLKRHVRIPLGAGIKVYPNLRSLSSYELFAYRAHLAASGTRSAKVRGAGTNFESLRNYQADDDFRRIHWKATARLGRPISVDYQIERSQNVVSLVDAGRLMGARVGPMTKLDYGVNAALMVSHVGGMAGDKTGALSFSSEVHAYVPPRQGRRQGMKIADALYDLAPRVIESDYDQAFGYFRLRNRKRSLVILFSDVLDALSSEALIRNLQGIAGKHLPLLVAIGDGHLAETADAVPATDEEAFRKAVAIKLLRDREAALQHLRRKGVWVLDVRPENLTVSVVNQYLELKTRNLL